MWSVERRRLASQTDQYFGKFLVSGQPCIVKAQYKGLHVEGHLSCGRSVKNFYFKFLSLTNRRVQNIEEELLRLYFDSVKNFYGKPKVKLLVEE